MERVILHSDANSFYASVEIKHRPELKDKPVAVCGDPAARHGVIVTKNPLAKKYSVLTGEPVNRALEKCPGLVLIGGDYVLYHRYSRLLRDIYESYTDHVEPYGLDEAWLDISQRGWDIQDGGRIAEEIRERVKRELGITVSVGVSFNKVFAKLGSDLKKPDAVTVISKANFKQRIWPLPVNELFYVGPRTAAKLAAMNIRTIGGLANCESWLLERRFGQNGLMLKAFASGLDDAPVRETVREDEAKSIGNSTTPPHDIANMEQARCIFTLLADSVAARLREGGYRTGCVAITARDTNLVTHGCQCTISPKTNITSEIASSAIRQFEGRFRSAMPFRSVGIQCTMLSRGGEAVQTDLMAPSIRRDRFEKIDAAVDGIRRRYGGQAIRPGIVMIDRDFMTIDPREERSDLPGLYNRM